MPEIKIAKVAKLKRIVYIMLIISVSFSILAIGLKKQMKSYLDEFLIKEIDPPDTSIDALYVLGGAYWSTYYHLKTAAVLFNVNQIKKLIVLKSNEKESSNTTLSSKNKWILKKLKANGVDEKYIEFLKVDGQFFGTLSEARALKKYLIVKHYNSVLLVTSIHHTRRVLLCFKHYLEKSNIKVYVKGSDHRFDFQEMIVETFKYYVYKGMLLFFS